MPPTANRPTKHQSFVKQNANTHPVMLVRIPKATRNHNWTKKNSDSEGVGSDLGTRWPHFHSWNCIPYSLPLPVSLCPGFQESFPGNGIDTNDGKRWNSNSMPWILLPNRWAVLAELGACYHDDGLWLPSVSATSTHPTHRNHPNSPTLTTEG